MKRSIWMLGLVMIALLVLNGSRMRADDGDPVPEFPDCGSISTNNDLSQWQNYRAVEMIAGTSRTMNLFCPGSVRVEAWVEGVAMATVIQENMFSANVDYATFVPNYGAWSSKSNHWYIFWPLWFNEGNKKGAADVEPPPPSDDPPPDPPCDSCDILASDSPILIDRTGGGYHLTSAHDGVWFDIEGKGVKTKVAWTDPDSDDAWLAMDRNGNGTIDNGTELFGNFTPAFPDNPTTCANGFIALKFLENPAYGGGFGGQPDDVLDSRDPAFKRLLLWRDKNHDGISQPDELTPAWKEGLVSIAYAYVNSKRVDRFGNQFKERGTTKWLGDDRDGRIRTVPVWDVWLATEK